MQEKYSGMTTLTFLLGVPILPSTCKWPWLYSIVCALLNMQITDTSHKRLYYKLICLKFYVRIWGLPLTHSFILPGIELGSSAYTRQTLYC